MGGFSKSPNLNSRFFSPFFFAFFPPTRALFSRIPRGNALLPPPRQQFAQQTLTRAEVRHHQRWQNPQQQMSKRLPRTARPVTAVESPRHLVEINLRLFAAP